MIKFQMKDIHYKINEEEAKIVKEIFESYVYKGIGTTKLHGI